MKKLADIIKKRLAALQDEEQAAFVVTTVIVQPVELLADLAADDVEFCSLDHIVEQWDDAADPFMLVARKEQSQGGPIALCCDVLIA